MKLKVTEQGVTIPKKFLGDMDEVEIVKENSRIIVKPIETPDPIWGLGQNPVDCGISDASENLDSYIYTVD